MEPYRLDPVPLSVRDAVMRQIFQKFDLDGDGELGLAELVNLRRSTNLAKGNWAFGRNAHLIQKIDTDGSSKVGALVLCHVSLPQLQKWPAPVLCSLGTGRSTRMNSRPISPSASQRPLTSGTESPTAEPEIRPIPSNRRTPPQGARSL